MKKFLLTAVVLAAIGFTTTASEARYAYVAAARDSSGYLNAGVTTSGLGTTSSRFSGPQSGWASSGAGPYAGPGISGTGYTCTGLYSLYASDAAPQRWAQWTFEVPNAPELSGYYDVYYGVRYAPTADQDMPPVWTIAHAGGTIVIDSQTSAVTSNTWVKLASRLLFNSGQSYTVRCSTTGLGRVNKRMNMDMVAWVFVEGNSPTGLTASLDTFGMFYVLNWAAPAVAPASYNIQRKANPTGTWQTIATGITSTRYEDWDAPGCGTSYYRVSAVDSAGVESGYSAEASVCCRYVGCTAQPAYGPNPANNASHIRPDLSNASVPGSLSWTAGQDTYTHDIYLGTNPAALEFKGNQECTTYDASYNPGVLVPETDYYWRIDEKNYYGMTTTGAVWHFRTGPTGVAYPPDHTALNRISDIWPLGNGYAKVYGFTDGAAKTVSAVVGEKVWIQETDRSAAIRVAYAPAVQLYFDDPAKTAVQAGDVIDICGTLKLFPGDDRVFSATYVRDRTIGTAAGLSPLSMFQRDILGTQASVTTPGLFSGKGIYSAGLFAKFAGSVIGTPTASYFYLDDMSFAPGTGVKVMSTAMPTGNVVVTGVLGMSGDSPVFYATNVH